MRPVNDSPARSTCTGAALSTTRAKPSTNSPRLTPSCHVTVLVRRGTSSSRLYWALQWSLPVRRRVSPRARCGPPVLPPVPRSPCRPADQVLPPGRTAPHPRAHVWRRPPLKRHLPVPELPRLAVQEDVVHALRRGDLRRVCRQPLSQGRRPLSRTRVQDRPHRLPRRIRPRRCYLKEVQFWGTVRGRARHVGCLSGLRAARPRCQELHGQLGSIGTGEHACTQGRRHRGDYNREARETDRTDGVSCRRQASAFSWATATMPSTYDSVWTTALSCSTMGRLFGHLGSHSPHSVQAPARVCASIASYCERAHSVRP